MPPLQPFSITQAPARLPVLLSVPHAGRAYSPALLGAARLSERELAILEDPLVDRLIERAVDAGAAAIVAHAPRAEIDLNRALSDLDPTMLTPPLGPATSPRASAGLGLIPSRLAGHGAIWRRGLPASEADRRIREVHRPYHDAIARRLEQLRARFGVAVLIDCHSMPSRGSAAAGIVFGDRHGTTAHEHLVAAAELACRARGLPTVRNEPYAGGEIVAAHGRPAEGVHAFQVEVDRSLYLAADLRSASPGIGSISLLIAGIVAAVAEAAACRHLIAAE